MKKILVMAVSILVVLTLVLLATKDTVAKIAVENIVKTVTGLDLSVKDLNIGLVRTLIRIKDLKLFNPQDFDDKLMLDMPEIFVDYDPSSIFSGKVHLSEVRLNLREFTVVKNRDGKLNLDALKAGKTGKGAEKTGAGEAGKMPDMRIDNLELVIGKAVYKDYSKGGEPFVQEFNIDLNERYQDITDAQKLVSLIVVKALAGTTIAKLANFDLSGFQSTVKDTLSTAERTIAAAAVGMQGTLAQTTQTTQEAVKDTAQVLKNTTDSLKSIIKVPFGGKKE